MISLKNIVFISLVILISGCASVANYTPRQSIPHDGTITVLPFKNNTDSPMAGQKAKNIMEGILVANNLPVKIIALRCNPDNIRSCLRRVRSRYYVQGNVNEWRYKTGLDAEPAVAVSFNIVDRTSGAVVYSAVGAKNGWGQESVGSVAQKLFMDLTKH